MQKAVKSGHPPLASCDGWKKNNGRIQRFIKSQPSIKNWTDEGSQAYMQMDLATLGGDCIFPQIEYLDHFHREAPNATFVLAFRPVTDWHSSMERWTQRNIQRNFLDRMVGCDLPGLPAGKGYKVEEIEAFWCQQVQRVRNFVKKHPSHTLIELDLYNGEDSADMMSQIFQSKRSCWLHANANPTDDEADEEIE